MDFRIGYSPERINPGDEEHTTESITKIVAGMDAESADRLAGLYGPITSVYRAKDVLGWEPVVGLEEGLKETIRYFEKPIRGSY